MPSNNTFPCNGPQRIRLPVPVLCAVPPANGQVPSWRVIFGRELVPVLSEANQAAADEEGYFPINAVFLAAIPCTPVGCEDSKIFIDDGLSRCTYTLNEATFRGPVATPALPQTMDFKAKISSDSIGTNLFHGSVGIDTSKSDPSNTRSITSGILVHVSGVLGTQFELWARIRNGQTPMPVEVRIQMIVDRLGGAPFAIPGNIAGGPDLPLPCCVPYTGTTGIVGP